MRVFLFFLTSAWAVDDWSFNKFPQPEYNQLTQAELEYLDESERSIPEHGEHCLELVNDYYHIYNVRYPAFKEWATSEIRYASWKKYVTRAIPRLMNSCLVSHLWGKLNRLGPKVLSLRFCGRYSRPPYTEIEKEAAALADELFEIVNISPGDTGTILINADDTTRFIEPDPEVEYYIARVRTH